MKWREKRLKKGFFFRYEMDFYKRWSFFLHLQEFFCFLTFSWRLRSSRTLLTGCLLLMDM